MPSQKQSKRRRHPVSAPTPNTRSKAPTRVPPPPTAPSGGRKASPKVLLITGGVVIAAAIAIVLAVTLGGGSSPSSSYSGPTIGTLKGALPGAAEVQKLFKGVPQDGNALGSPQAPVTMVEYVDLQCPYCREFEAGVIPKLVSTYVRPGQLRVEQRLLAFIGPDSVRGRNAALAAGLQQKQFNYTELLYFDQGTENTGWLDQKTVESTAASIPGLNVPRLLDQQGSSTVAAKATALDAEAKAQGVNSTPTILVGPTGGTLQQVTLTSPTDYTTVKEAIDSALAG